MDDFFSIIMMLVFIIGVLLLLALNPRTGFSSSGLKLKRAIPAPWTLSEFLKMKPNRWKVNQCYFFSEENIRSLGHRFVGRLDGAVLHYEDAPILDTIIEYKFPLKRLPRKPRLEDVFQAGLYALSLLESGVSCSSTRLVTIYCLQDRAKRCLEMKSARECWRCTNGKTFVTRFKPKSVLTNLRKLDEVWYKGRQPRPTQEQSTCRICPYHEGKCNYSLV